MSLLSHSAEKAINFYIVMRDNGRNKRLRYCAYTVRSSQSC